MTGLNFSMEALILILIMIGFRMTHQVTKKIIIYKLQKNNKKQNK